MMKAAVMYGQDDIRVQSVPVPSINNGEVLVRVRASGICATDIKNAGKPGFAQKPAGHPWPRSGRYHSKNRCGCK